MYQKHLEICRAATNGPHYEFFTSFARNNIEHYITRCIELEVDNKRLRDERKRFIEALEYYARENEDEGRKAREALGWPR